MFIAARFTTAKRRKQHNCPLMDGRINKLVMQTMDTVFNYNKGWNTHPRYNIDDS